MQGCQTSPAPFLKGTEGEGKEQEGKDKAHREGTLGSKALALSKVSLKKYNYRDQQILFVLFSQF